MQKNILDYRLLSFWSWNGEMKSEEIRCQIQQFAEKGYGGFFIHARAGLLLDYMQEDWLEACRVAIEEAKKLGLSVWLYDEDGWPSGFASGKVNGEGEAFQAKKLVFTDKRIDDKKGYHLLAAYCRQNGSFVRCNSDNPEAALFCGYEIENTYADVLCREAVGKFIRVTHQVYYDRFKEYFGTVVRGIFTDEPQTLFPAWSMEMEAAYRKNWGLDILDDLWMLQESKGDYRNFRYRYFDTVSKLFVENYTKQINEWCIEHGIHMTGHFPNEDGGYMQVKLTGGVMPNYPYMGMPGIDFLGRRYPSQVLLKQVSSVAHQTGKKQVLSESYGCAGWDITFSELMSIADYQAVMGVNTLCTHLSAYTIFGRRKRDYPAFYSYQEPWWEQFSFVSNYIKTLNEILSGLKRFTKVAVLHPLRSLWCEVQISDAAQGVVNAGAAAAESTQFRMLVENLNDLQIDFDLIDDDMLIDMVCEDGSIRNEHVSYDILIIPQMGSICDRTRKYISDFGNRGGVVLTVNGIPRYVEGRETAQILNCPFTEVYNSHNSLMKQFLAMHYVRECVLLDEKQHNPIRGLITYYGERENERVCFAFNQSDGTLEATARQTGKWYPYLYDCAQNKTTKLPFTQDEEATYVKIKLDSKKSCMIRFYRKPIQAESYLQEQRNYLVEDVQVELSENNALNIDYASYRMGGGAWSERMPVIHLADEIYQKNNGRGKDLQVRYCFTAEYLSPRLSLAVEKVHGVQVEVNGIQLESGADWWIDKTIACYDISEVAKIGENEVIITYHMDTEEGYIDFSEQFENERNRFFYTIEPESIYILGAFDVSIDREVKTTPSYHLLKQGACFYLSKPSCKRMGDLTSQGLWFYRGTAEYSFELTYEGTSCICVHVKEMCGTAVAVRVNEIEAGVYTGTDAIDITDILHLGTNRVTLRILGHNRNLLGPHHHQKKTPIFVGPSTFTGKKGFEDFVNPEILTNDTWTDDYSFIPFGCSGIEITEAILDRKLSREGEK